MENLKDYIKKYDIISIDESNINDVYCLCKSNKKYYEYLQENLTLDNVKKIMTDLPPNKDLSDKYLMGFCQNGELIAVLDLVDGYPQKDIAFIGLFLVDNNYHNRGVGRYIISNLLEFLQNNKFISCELGVIEDTQEAIIFWEKMGFRRTGTVYRHEKYDVIMMSYNF